MKMQRIKMNRKDYGVDANVQRITDLWYAAIVVNIGTMGPVLKSRRLWVSKNYLVLNYIVCIQSFFTFILHSMRSIYLLSVRLYPDNLWSFSHRYYKMSDSFQYVDSCRGRLAFFCDLCCLELLIYHQAYFYTPLWKSRPKRIITSERSERNSY